MTHGTPSPLARFQDAFAHALFAAREPVAPCVAALVAQPAFAVYRNTVMKGCIDALQANFPAVVRLVGEDWFRAAAAEFVAHEPPAEPSLLAYGDGFPDFLQGFPPAADLPYLAGVARLDRLWTQAHAAADAPALERSALSGIDPETLARAVLHPHPAARWAWFADAPIHAIWSRNREATAVAGEIAWSGDGALLTRPRDVVLWRALEEPGCRLLDACAQGCTVAQAADACLDLDPDADLARLLGELLDAGAFERITLPETT